MAEKIGENLDNQVESRENLEGIKNTVVQALKKAFEVHQSLGESGREKVEKNQFGDTALRMDIEAEKAILDFLRESNFPIRVISEEHGTVDIGEAKYLGILDGLDGSGVYEKGAGRCGTMFGIFDGLDPKYKNYLVSGVMEYPLGRLYIASKNGGASMIQGDNMVPIHSSGETVFDKDSNIYINEEYFLIIKKIFSEKLKGFKKNCADSSAVHYADVASGIADLTIECTRKYNLEIAIAYGLEKEAGAVMVDIEGNDLGDKKYLEFGQKDHLPIITAATRELAENLLKHIK